MSPSKWIDIVTCWVLNTGKLHASGQLIEKQIAEDKAVASLKYYLTYKLEIHMLKRRTSCYSNPDYLDEVLKKCQINYKAQS